MKKKRSIGLDIALLVIVLAVMALAVVLVVLKANDRNTNTRSTDLATFERKLSFLEEYMDCPSPLLDAEYHVVFRTARGSRKTDDWAIAAVVKVAPADVPLWTAGLDKVDTAEIDMNPWITVPREPLAEPEWAVTSEPVYCQSPNGWVVAYTEEGVVYWYGASASAPSSALADSVSQAT